VLRECLDGWHLPNYDAGLLTGYAVEYFATMAKSEPTP